MQTRHRRYAFNKWKDWRKRVFRDKKKIAKMNGAGSAAYRTSGVTGRVCDHIMMRAMFGNLGLAVP